MHICCLLAFQPLRTVRASSHRTPHASATGMRAWERGNGGLGEVTARNPPSSSVGRRPQAAWLCIPRPGFPTRITHLGAKANVPDGAPFSITPSARLSPENGCSRQIFWSTTRVCGLALTSVQTPLFSTFPSLFPQTASHCCLGLGTPFMPATQSPCAHRPRCDHCNV